MDRWLKFPVSIDTPSWKLKVDLVYMTGSDVENNRYRRGRLTFSPQINLSRPEVEALLTALTRAQQGLAVGSKSEGWVAASCTI